MPDGSGVSSKFASPGKRGRLEQKEEDERGLRMRSLKMLAELAIFKTRVDGRATAKGARASTAVRLGGTAPDMRKRIDLGKFCAQIFGFFP